MTADQAGDAAYAAVTVAGRACELAATPEDATEYAAGGSGRQHLGDGYYRLKWKRRHPAGRVP